MIERAVELTAMTHMMDKIYAYDGQDINQVVNIYKSSIF